MAAERSRFISIASGDTNRCGRTWHNGGVDGADAAVKSNFHPMICREDKDLARCFAFIIETKREADPDLSIVDAYEMMLRSMRFGNVICYDNEHGQAVGMASYTIGTMAADYEDRDTAYVEYCLMDPRLQRTFYFLKCLQFLAQTIENEHDGVKWFTLRAYEKSEQNNRLYAKFTRKIGEIEGRKGRLNLYQTSMPELQAYLQRFRLKPDFGRR